MNEDIQMLKDVSDRLIAGTNLDFKRYLYPKIDWRNRFVCLKGAKGTGKTTILKQSMKERFGLSENAFYLSFDHLWFTNHSALELVDDLHKNGVSHLFIDEVHHIEHWETILKNIYDFYPDLCVAYSGSSILRLHNREGDLSRRQLCYGLKGLSFREFLAFEGEGDFAPVPLSELLVRHREMPPRSRANGRSSRCSPNTTTTATTRSTRNRRADTASASSSASTRCWRAIFRSWRT